MDQAVCPLIRSQGITVCSPLIEDVAFENMGEEKAGTDAYRLLSQSERFLSLTLSVETPPFPVQSPWVSLDSYRSVIVSRYQQYRCTETDMIVLCQGELTFGNTP